MNKILVLDSKITNRISAGEVVEKPASIVKELLENSIDAGADRITIEIEEGGSRKIAITDNGTGIANGDLLLAISPHATSKIKTIEDLDNITSLGFRGEALASIASVCMLEIITKTSEEEIGSLLKADGGDVKENTHIACPTGTHIEVNSLFYNTPVRAKFLRKPKTEEADITDYVERIILAFPHISFKYILNGKTKYNTTGGGLLDNIYTIYGKDAANAVLPVNFKRDGYEITGFIGKPEISKPNRKYQTLLIAGRYVKNYMVSSAVQNAYDNFLMKHKFPFYVLNLNMPTDSVDVNVHPNKLEVKFDKSNQVFSAFYAAVLETLNSSNQTKDINLVEDNAKIEENNFTQKLTSTIDSGEGTSFNRQDNSLETLQEKVFGELKSNLDEQKIESSKFTFTKSTYPDKQMFASPKEVTIISNQENFEEAEQQAFTSQKQEQNVIDVFDYKIIGTLFDTYNIIQSDNVVYFIDQHAAHERILYDKFTNQINTQNITSQELLMPYTIKVQSVEANFLNEYMPVLFESGFKIEEFGINTFKVTAVPYIFAQLNLENFFNDLLSNMNEYSKKPFDYLKDKIATKACKAAVKAGNKLTNDEIKLIFDSMKKGVLHCPHGRPFVMKLDRNQVEKWFKRVL